MGTGKIKQTVQQLDEMIPKAASAQERVDRMNRLAWQSRIRDPERAFVLSLDALESSKSAGTDGQAYEQGIAASLVTLSFLDGEAGKLDTSISRALQALSHLKEQPRSEILVDAWYTLGWAYYYSGDYPASLEFGLKALKTARENGLVEKEAWCLDLVASTYRDPLQAIQMYKEAYEIFEKVDSIEGRSRILNNWAYTLM